MPIHHLLVGTFNTNLIATLAFDTSKRSLEVVAKNEGQAPHSWLALNAAKDRLYATSWTEPPGLASYRIERATASSSVPTVSPINSVTTAARSGYVCVSPIAAYSAGGPTGEVFRLDDRTGGFAQDEHELQKLSFVGGDTQRNDGGVLDFGGLRHGAHSFDLSPDGKLAYVADIGRNAIFVFKVDDVGTLTLTEKNMAPRSNDGPRHVTPHPNGKYVYSLQEHSSMVDTFEVDPVGTLRWVRGVKIIPSDHTPDRYWADEVQISPSQRFLYCSTRGLEPTTKGWLAVYALSPDGLPASGSPIVLYETATSGGWANAVQPAPGEYNEGAIEYLALTDSEQGFVYILSFDGVEVVEVARTKLEYGTSEKVVGAATAVWL